MVKNYGKISEKVDGLLHGADYNPEQWLHKKEVLEEDLPLMRMANCNVMTLNIFGWSTLEPKEGEYNFEWLDERMDKLHKNGIKVILATPSGARPAWLSKKYVETNRVSEKRVRQLPGIRHNHCYTSPVYRAKVKEINKMLAERYKNHPALIMWHISNEFEGECHCPLCQEAFREWLKEKYHNNLDELNLAWWNHFWSHTYTSWDEIESPSSEGEKYVHGLNLDWKRFVSDQTIDFMKEEIKAVKSITPNVPVTSNTHDYVILERSLNYWELTKHIDVVSWDNYPKWHKGKDEWLSGVTTGFIHDINRSLKKGKPFMMMECSPSATNWQSVAKLRRPGMHTLQGLQAIAHGSDTVQYFQWRKSLGSFEKFHGAVIDHYATSETRVFKEVAKLGSILNKLNNVAGTSVKPEVAIIYDWENYWAMNDSQAPNESEKKYFETCVNHYKSFWKRGIPVDVINMTADLSRYRLVIAPMLYMVKEGVGDSITKFVEDGGTFVSTYWSGIVNDTDLAFTTGRPGPLRKVLGIWSEEIDALYEGESNKIITVDHEVENKTYVANTFCDLIHCETAEKLAEYMSDFYKGYPALTKNKFGKGFAYYITSRNESPFLDDFYEQLILEAGVKKILDIELPEGVTVTTRYDNEKVFYFIMNFTDKRYTIPLPRQYMNVIDELKVNHLDVSPYNCVVLTDYL